MSNATANITSATPQIDLYNAIETLMTAHDNWTLVDTAVISTATYKVWKNHGTGVTDNNSFGQDFYLVIAYTTTGAGNMSIRACEDVTVGSDLMIRPVMEDASNPTLADASGIASVTYASSAGAMTVTFTPAVSPNTSTYYIVLTKNNLHLGLKRSDSATVYSCYAGLFDSFVTIANEFPLCMISNTAGNTNITTHMAGTSRHPGRISQAAVSTNFIHTVIALTTTGGDTGNVDLFRGKAQAAPAALRTAASASAVTSSPTFGALRGKLYDTVFLPIQSGGVVTMGDVLDDIGGNNYWFFGYGNVGGIFVNSAAV